MAVCTRCGKEGHTAGKCSLCGNCFQEGHKLKDCTNESVSKSPYQLQKEAGKTKQASSKTESSAQAKAGSSSQTKKGSSTQAKKDPTTQFSATDTGDDPSGSSTATASAEPSTSVQLPHREAPQPSGDSSREELYEPGSSQTPVAEAGNVGRNPRRSEKTNVAPEPDVPLPKSNRPVLSLNEYKDSQPDPPSTSRKNPFEKEGQPPKSQTIRPPEGLKKGISHSIGQRESFASTEGLATKHVLTNHFQVHEIPNKIYRYSLVLEPSNAIVGRKEHRRVFLAIRDSADAVFPKGARWATDLLTLWSLDELNLPQQGKDFFVFVQKEIGGLTDEIKAHLAQDQSSPLSFNSVFDLSGQPPGSPGDVGPTSSEELAAAVNALVSRFAVERENKNANGIDDDYSNITQVGANRFFVNRFCRHLSFTKAAQGKPPVLYANVGFSLSVRPGNSFPYVNVNSAASVFYTPIKVSEFMQRMNVQNARPSILEEMLKSVRVKICYKRKKASLNTLSMQIKRIATFGEIPGNIYLDAVQMSVTEFFKNNLNVTLESPNLRCVNVGSIREADWVPPECLQIVPGQAARQSVLKYGEFTEQVIEMACRKPLKNRMLIEGYGLEELRLGSFTKKPSTDSQVSDFQIWPSMVRVPSHKLPPPKILELNRKQDKPQDQHRAVVLNERDNSWRIQGRFAGATPNMPERKFVVLNLAIGQSVAQVPSLLDFAQTLEKTLKDKGLKLTLNDKFPVTRGETPIEVQGPDEQSLLQNLRDQVRRALTNCQSSKDPRDGAAFAVIVIPSKKISTFQSIKAVADLEFGAPTFVCVRSKLTAPNANLNTFCQTFSLKICTRIVGPTHLLASTSHIPTFNPKETLAIGADVTHPSAGSRPGTPSIATVVANLDRNFMKWPGSMTIQRSRQEMISDMQGMAEQRIVAWKRENTGSVIRNIVFFRDGVSESQYDEVMTTEVVAIQNAHAKAYPVGANSPKLKLTVIVCGKRHHVRFYPNSTDEKANVDVGTVIDRVVTHPWRLDWFLHSHYAGIGTARSTHYVVLRNDLKAGALELQKFTNNLTYVWGRACRPVSLVAPAYYADILCERGRCYLQTWLNAGGGPTREQRESNDSFNDRVLHYVRDNFWALGQSRTRGTEITSVSSPAGPWHSAMDNTMLYI